MKYVCIAVGLAFLVIGFTRQLPHCVPIGIVALVYGVKCLLSQPKPKEPTPFEQTLDDIRNNRHIKY